MTNMQRLVVVFAFIFAVLLGILLATTLLGGTAPSSPTASPFGSSKASASGAASSTAPQSASTSPSASAAASPSPTPSPSPSPTTKPAANATVSFMQLALDATSDASGTTRTISTVAQTGTVTVKLKTESGGNTKVCLLADGKQLACHTGVTSTLTGTTSKKTSNFQVTLRGSGSATPVVDVTITFPATKPKVTITNARFDGTDSPATNGLMVVATPRANGNYSVTASWGGHPFTYEVDLIEQGGGPGLKQITASTGATKTSQSFAVTKTHAWMIVLKNTESGFGPTPLTATFTWP